MVLCANYKISFTGNTLKLRVSTGDQLDAAVVTFFFSSGVHKLTGKQPEKRARTSVCFILLNWRFMLNKVTESEYF